MCNTDTMFVPTKGNTYSVVLAWLNSGDFALEHQRGEFDYNLYITDLFGKWYHNVGTVDPYEKVTFTATSDDPLLVFICKMKDEKTSTPINFGLSILEVE